MRRPLPSPIVAGLLALAAAARVQAEPLKPTAARKVEQNAPAVTTELRDVIGKNDSPEGFELQQIVAASSRPWGIRYRDGYLLFSIPVNRSLNLREKKSGEAEAKALALVTLTQKFNPLLELKNNSQGLDEDAIRVIFIEPDAERAYAAASLSRSQAMQPVPGAASCPCLPLPPACGCQ